MQMREKWVTYRDALNWLYVPHVSRNWRMTIMKFDGKLRIMEAICKRMATGDWSVIVIDSNGRKWSRVHSQMPRLGLLERWLNQHPNRFRELVKELEG